MHPSLGSGPALVHVDAYRLGGIEELDDLDLDADLDSVVTVVEWGHGVAEVLSEDWLEIVLTRQDESRADDIDGDQPRRVQAHGHGQRWGGAR